MPFRGRALTSLLCRIGALTLPFIFLLSAFAPGYVSADEGVATWYGQPYHGRTMANGQRYDMYDPTTTASNMYPFGTWLRVTNPANGRSITVQVRDRGAFTHALDLSYAAFAALDDTQKMRLRVTYEVVSGPGQAPQTQPAPSMGTPAPPPAAAATESKPQSSSEYVAAAGDTLVGIAQRFGILLADLVRVNGIANPDRLPIGSRLQVSPGASSEQRSAPPEGTSTRSAAAAQPADITEHTVVAGETLWGLAVTYKLTPAELVLLNDIGNPDHLTVGQRLRISRASKPAASTALVQSTEHTVATGETLWDIALRYTLTPAELVALNELNNPDRLAVGQRLRVSGASRPAPAASVAVGSQPATLTSSRPYVVQPDDTLSSIAGRFETTVAQLQALNALSNADLLQPGQVLKLP